MGVAKLEVEDELDELYIVMKLYGSATTTM